MAEAGRQQMIEYFYDEIQCECRGYEGEGWYFSPKGRWWFGPFDEDYQAESQFEDWQFQIWKNRVDQLIPKLLANGWYWHYQESDFLKNYYLVPPYSVFDSQDDWVVYIRHFGKVHHVGADILDFAL
jgi:hypothetical protein